jgi:hypothetical protein
VPLAWEELRDPQERVQRENSFAMLRRCSERETQRFAARSAFDGVGVCLEAVEPIEVRRYARDPIDEPRDLLLLSA